MPKPNDYSGDKIVVLEGLEPVRRRPAMYIGSTDVNGLHHIVTEIVDNSVDDGRGIPIDVVSKYGKSALEIVMTKLHAGGKFEGTAYKVSGGLHGVGASVVNALSEWTKVTVLRDNAIYQQEYQRGAPKTPVVKKPVSALPVIFPNPSALPKTYTSGTIVSMKFR